MKNFDETKQILQEYKEVMRDKYHVKNLGIFGSLLRHEETQSSDIDILVEFTKPVGFFTFLDLEEYLEEKLQNKVDLVTKNALKPEIGKYILNSVAFV